MKKLFLKAIGVILSISLLMSTVSILSSVVMADDEYIFTTADVSNADIQNYYDSLVTENGNNILLGKSTYAKTSVWTSTMIDKGWTNLTDGLTPVSDNSELQNIGTSYYNNKNTDDTSDDEIIDAYRKWYYDLSEVNQIDRLSLFNYISWGSDLEICNFKVYVSNDISTLWNDENEVASYVTETNDANKQFNVIDLSFTNKPQGQYLGIFWDYPACFRTKNLTNYNSSVILTEIAAFGDVVNQITATAGEGGTISPDGATNVVVGENQTYTITPNKGYIIDNVIVDGESVGAVSTYTFSNVAEAHTILASFVKKYTVTYTKTWSAIQNTYTTLKNAYGTNYLYGKTAKYYANGEEKEISVDTNRNVANLTDEISYDSTTESNQYVNLNAGSFPNLHFEFTNKTKISQITVFNNTGWNTQHELASFDVYLADSLSELYNDENRIVDYDVNTCASHQGHIAIQIAFAEAAQKAGKYIGFKWNDPYNFADGSSGIVLSEIVAFGTEVPTITATADSGGSITPLGTVDAELGGSMVYTIKADANSVIEKIYIDEEPINEGAGETEYTYTFENIDGSHTIHVDFLSDYVITNDICSTNDLAAKYTALTEQGEDLLANKIPYGYAQNLDHNFVDKSTAWSSLTDGDASITTFTNIDGRFYGLLYFELDNITDIKKIVLANYLINQQELQLASFDVFVGCNADTLWDETNIVASYNKTEMVENTGADFISIDFETDSIAKGKYIGFRWNAPYNFKDNSGGTVITEIAAFGTEYDTVTAIANDGGTVSPADDTLLTSNVEYTFKPDDGYKVKSVMLDVEEVAFADNKYTVAADGSSHSIEVEFAVVGDINSDKSIDSADVTAERQLLLGLTTDETDKDINNNGECNIVDLLVLKKKIAAASADTDIEMLAKALGLTHFEIKEAIERADDLNDISNVNIARLRDVLKKAKSGESITIATIGGSITEGAKKTATSGDDEIDEYFGTRCYAEQLQKWFADTYYDGDLDKVKLENAGIGATPSFLGSFRLNSMVLDKNPDLVVVEFSCNDFSTISYPSSNIYLGTDAYKAYESIVRRSLESGAAVMQLFMGHTEERGLWNIHRVIGSHYQVPMISFENAVYPNDACIIEDTGKIYADGVHPNNVGYAFVAKTITDYLEEIDLDDITVENDVPEDNVYDDKYISSANTIIYANEIDDYDGFTLSASVSGISSKWGGVFGLSEGSGTITATVPAGAKAVYVIYQNIATTGSFETTLGTQKAVTTNFDSTATARMSWATAYSGDTLSTDTEITLTSSSAELYVAGFAIEYESGYVRRTLAK